MERKEKKGKWSLINLEGNEKVEWMKTKERPRQLYYFKLHYSFASLMLSSKNPYLLFKIRV